MRTTTTYRPNLDEPRTGKKTRQKIREACGWAYATCSKTPQVITKAKIDKKLGQSSHNLGNYLRAKLLTCVDSFVRFGVASERGVAKRYILNQQGYRELMGVLDGDKPLPAEFVPTLAHGTTRECVNEFLQREARSYETELECLTFQMQQKGDCPRLFHPLQFMNKEVKALFWDKRLPFNYDIQSCAPTLIYQQALQLGMTHPCASIDALLADPLTYRTALADRVGINYKQAKVIINALFCGATLGRGNRFELFRLVDSNVATMNLLRDDAWLWALREEIKACWDTLAAAGVVNRRKSKASSCYPNGRMLPLRCKDKWNFYFGLERLVLDTITEYLTAQGIKHFPEHDGFRADVDVDVVAVQAYVAGDTGFAIKVIPDSQVEDHRSPDASGVVRIPSLSRAAACSDARATDESGSVEDSSLINSPFLPYRVTDTEGQTSLRDRDEFVKTGQDRNATKTKTADLAT